MNEDNKFFENLFLEIKDGFSEFDFQDQVLYIKHSDLNQLKVINDNYEFFLGRAKKMGIPTEEQVLQDLEEGDLWTKKDESLYQSLEIEISNIKKTLSNLFVEKEKNNLKQRLNEAEKEYLEKKNIRSALTLNSAEQYAERKSNEKFVFHSLYKDKECSNLFYNDDEFDEIDNKELSELYVIYNNCAEKFSNKNLKLLSISQMFTSLLNIYSKDLSNFFKKHPLDLTFYQINLLNYGKLFLSIFQNHEIPESISKDPEKILEHIDKSKKIKKENLKEKSSKSDGFSYAGATQKELEKMGGKKQKGVDIHSIAGEKGGELSMDDFMKIHKK
jgi:hypothetical protein